MQSVDNVSKHGLPKVASTTNWLDHTLDHLTVLRRSGISAEEGNLIVDALLASLAHDDVSKRIDCDDLEESAVKEAA
jgi:hypothetical protein